MSFETNILNVLDKTQPGDKTCRICGKAFFVYQEDLDFYEKFVVPIPTLCPLCRRERRMVFRNERNLFSRKCGKTGVDLISMYRNDSPYKIYDEKEWWSDGFDGATYGMDLDLNKSFFKQFQKLRIATPRPHLIGDPSNENVQYSNNTGNDKNCYMIFVTYKNEDCMYGDFFGESRDCVDMFSCAYSELCYENVSCEQNYGCKYCFNTKNSRDSYFLAGCRDCKNCFMCSNLRHKEYCFENKQLSKDDYLAKMESMNLGSYSAIEKLKLDFVNMMKASPHEGVLVGQCENSVGDSMWRCKNAFDVFNEMESENLRYCTNSGRRKDCLDVDYGGIASEVMYETIGGGMQDYMIKFSNMVRGSRDMEYCDLCMGCQDCFGCVGLRSKKYCILNKQYEKKEYFELIEQIKIKMLERKEYGEFLPFAFGSIPYIDTVANMFFPDENNYESKIKKDLEYFGMDYDYSYSLAKSVVDTVVDSDLVAKNIPDHIDDVNDDILNKIIICEESKKPFRITKKELEYYRKNGIPIPRFHPAVRYRKRFLMEIPHAYNLNKIKCNKCGKEIDSRYKEEDGYNIYCGECYEGAMK